MPVLRNRKISNEYAGVGAGNNNDYTEATEDVDYHYREIDTF